MVLSKISLRTTSCFCGQGTTLGQLAMNLARPPEQHQRRDSKKSQSAHSWLSIAQPPRRPQETVLPRDLRFLDGKLQNRHHLHLYAYLYARSRRAHLTKPKSSIVAWCDNPLKILSEGTEPLRGRQPDEESSFNR